MSYSDYNKIIAFQGSKGAHSHLVTKDYFPNASHIAHENFEDVFTAIENDKANIGVIPIENSHAGRVPEIHNLLKDTELYIIAEFFLNVRHNLAAIKGSELSNITDIYSHPQALMQSSKALKEISARKHSFINTALAAEFVAKEKNKNYATLCSDLAAQINNLIILKTNMQNDSNNKTTFVAIAKDMEELPGVSDKKITTLLFTVRNIPAAIYKCLGGFATNNINIIKLESYIPGGVSGEAQFFLSFQGNTEDKSVQLAMEELGFYTKKIKLLGSYDQAVERVK